jgi:hypothetical protein
MWDRAAHATCFTPSIHHTEGVGLKASLDVLEKSKILLLIPWLSTL